METTIEIRLQATSPCPKFSNANLRDQVQKIKSEVLEVEEALEKFLNCLESGIEPTKSPVKLLMEMYDVVACVNTLNMQLKYRYPDCFSTQIREEAEEAVITKNMARGYYAPEV